MPLGKHRRCPLGCLDLERRAVVLHALATTLAAVERAGLGKTLPGVDLFGLGDNRALFLGPAHAGKFTARRGRRATLFYCAR